MSCKLRHSVGNWAGKIQITHAHVFFRIFPSMDSFVHNIRAVFKNIFWTFEFLKYLPSHDFFNTVIFIPTIFLQQFHNIFQSYFFKKREIHNLFKAFGPGQPKNYRGTNVDISWIVLKFLGRNVWILLLPKNWGLQTNFEQEETGMPLSTNGTFLHTNQYE